MSRKPRKVNTGVQYTEAETSEDDNLKNSKTKRNKPKTSSEGPSATQIKSQKVKMEYPKLRLPPVPSNSDDTEDAEIPADQTPTKTGTSMAVVPTKSKPKV